MSWNSDSEIAEALTYNRVKLANYGPSYAGAHNNFITMKIHYRLILDVLEASWDVKVAYALDRSPPSFHVNSVHPIFRARP